MPSPTASGSSASHRSSIRRSFGRRLRRRSGSPRRRWPRELHDRELLLLLDNFEQLIEAAAVVGELLQAAPRLRVLSTSRARLHVYGEHELEIPPLPAAEAEELFVRRARATGRELPPGELVTEICSRLDGLPLAIELVAARTAELTPAELVSSLDDKLELASKGARDLPERQQTLPRRSAGATICSTRTSNACSRSSAPSRAASPATRCRRSAVPTRPSSSPGSPRPTWSGGRTTAAFGCSKRSASTPSSASSNRARLMACGVATRTIFSSWERSSGRPSQRRS